nr:MAG TPA: hypothetical protein [Caudoviricetes sp.]
MRKYSLNLGENGRILSVGNCQEGQNYENIVDSFPDGDVTEYRYENGEFIHDPLPKPEKEPTAEEDALSMIVDHEYRLTLLELGVTE